MLPLVGLLCTKPFPAFSPRNHPPLSILFLCIGQAVPFQFYFLAAGLMMDDVYEGWFKKKQKSGCVMTSGEVAFEELSGLE